MSPTQELQNPSTAVSRFVWYELHTPNADVAARFYGPVLGWKTQNAGVPNRKYELVSVSGVPVGGLLEKQLGPGEHSGWIGYIGVDDADESSRRVQSAGGVIHRAAEQIPGVGTFAVAGDPAGAIFTLFEAPKGMKQPDMPAASTPGMPAWRELAAANVEQSFEFYSRLFGWTTAHDMDMGPGLTYKIFATGAEPAGGVMTFMQPGQSAAWLFYFNVDEMNAAFERVKANGGTLIYGPSPVPGDQQIAHCADTQGAVFGIVAPGNAQ